MKTLQEMTDKEIQDEVRRLEGELDRRNFPYKVGDSVYIAGRVLQVDCVYGRMVAEVEINAAANDKLAPTVWVKDLGLYSSDMPF